MSLLDCDLHEQQGHSRHLVYAFNTSGTSLCVLCFLTSITDDAVLATRRSYVVRCTGGAAKEAWAGAVLLKQGAAAFCALHPFKVACRSLSIGCIGRTCRNLQ